MKCKLDRKNLAGFSLLEILAVIAIIAVLMTIIVATYTMAMGKRDEKKIESELEAIKLAIEYYHTEHNIYPEEGPTPAQNSLFLSLTQDGEQGKKNFLRNYSGQNDGNGNLVAPVPKADGTDGYNFWNYRTGKNAEHNSGRYDLWVEYPKGKETMLKGNW